MTESILFLTMLIMLAGSESCIWQALWNTKGNRGHRQWRCAANAAVAVARLGGRAALAGPLGGPASVDVNGDRVLAALIREGVDVSGCERIPGVPTPISAIAIDSRGERMIVTYRDARIASATPHYPDKLAVSVDVVLIDNRFPNFVLPIAKAARARSIAVVLDADRPTHMGEELFALASHVVFSSECLLATAGTQDLAEGLARMAGATEAFLAVTMGPTTCSGVRGTRCGVRRYSPLWRWTRLPRATSSMRALRWRSRKGGALPKPSALPQLLRGSNARGSAAARRHHGGMKSKRC
jgi:sugar/nucleoside kinase (ribokinase family)